jgi:hypothetical protein
MPSVPNARSHPCLIAMLSSTASLKGDVAVVETLPFKKILQYWESGIVGLRMDWNPGTIGTIGTSETTFVARTAGTLGTICLLIRTRLLSSHPSSFILHPLYLQTPTNTFFILYPFAFIL